MKTIGRFLVWIFLMGSCGPVLAADGWQTDVYVHAQKATIRLSVGQKADTQEGVDPKYDVPALLSGKLQAYLQGSEGAEYWRKLAPSCLLQPCARTWNVFIDSTLKGKVVSLNWEPESIPSGIELILTDMTTETKIDMKTQTEYTYKNRGQRQFMIEAFK